MQKTFWGALLLSTPLLHAQTALPSADGFKCLDPKVTKVSDDTTRTWVAVQEKTAGDPKSCRLVYQYEGTTVLVDPLSTATTPVSTPTTGTTTTAQTITLTAANAGTTANIDLYLTTAGADYSYSSAAKHPVFLKSACTIDSYKLTASLGQAPSSEPITFQLIEANPAGVNVSTFGIVTKAWSGTSLTLNPTGIAHKVAAGNGVYAQIKTPAMQTAPRYSTYSLTAECK